MKIPPRALFKANINNPHPLSAELLIADVP
jgi:hypothetical protein